MLVWALTSFANMTSNQNELEIVLVSSRLTGILADIFTHRAGVMIIKIDNSVLRLKQA